MKTIVLSTTTLVIFHLNNKNQNYSQEINLFGFERK